MVVLVCAACGESFERTVGQAYRTTRPAQQVFCSMACRRRRVARTCEECGASFEVSVSEAAKRPGRWCSRECCDLGRKRGETRTCLACGASFYLYPSTKQDRRGAFCSMACYTTQKSSILRGIPKPASMRAKLSAARKGKTYPERHKPPVVVTCLQCGLTTEYTGRRRHFAKVRKFCTTECWYTYLRNHPEAGNWFKGGYEPYYGPNWAHQAKLARERDGHRCQACGVHQFNPRLDVHHRKGRRFFDHDDWEQMNALDNLITLCKSCHTTVETTRRGWG